MLELDFSNMMEEVIGVKGITVKSFEGIRSRIADVHARIVGRSWKELAFLDLPHRGTEEIKRTAEEIRARAGHFLVVGTGGSGLGPKAVRDALSPLHNLRKRPRVLIADNADPRTLHNILSFVDVEDTVVNVISKSGGTAETMASFMVLWEWAHRAVGERAAEHFIITTDLSSGALRKIADQHRIKTFEIAAGVGGRYSVLSPVGLLMAEVIGFDAGQLLRGAQDMLERCSMEEPWRNPAYLLAGLLYLMNTEEGRTVTVMMPYADGLKSFAEWFCKLWSESLGKLGMGMTPYPSLGPSDQHSQLQLWLEGPDDKVILFVRVEDYGVDVPIPTVFGDCEPAQSLSGHSLAGLVKAEQESTEFVLAGAGRPNMAIRVPVLDAYHVGQLFFFLEISTVCTGFLLNINPFNQPGVELQRQCAWGLMGKQGLEARRHDIEASRSRRICWKV